MPVKAKQAHLAGDVLVTATVGTDGKLLNPVIAKGLSPECNAEALRVVQVLPPGSPLPAAVCPCPCWCKYPCHSTTRA
ncbi:MAG: energy transducer TonB [Hymenobacter sp.]